MAQQSLRALINPAGTRPCVICGLVMEMRVHQKFCGNWRQKTGCAYQNRLQWRRDWTSKYPEKVSEQGKKYRSLYPEKSREMSRKARSAWYLRLKIEDSERLKTFNHANERRCRQAEGKHSTKEWLALKSKYGNKCLACKKPEEEAALTRDHIVPLILGGTNFITNIQPLCRSCNSSKQAKTIYYG